jgi:hypothetical protein
MMAIALFHDVFAKPLVSGKSFMGISRKTTGGYSFTPFAAGTRIL